MSSEQNKVLVRRFFDEMCNGKKLNVADEIYSKNHAYHDPSYPTGPGPQGVKDVISTYQNGFGDAHWAVNEAFADEDQRVIVRWTGSGTQSGELLGIPPTGRKVSVTGIWIFKTDGGKIVESWNHWDTLGMLQQLGVVPILAASKN